MRAGEFPDGSRTLRAKIDMASPNINLRDPALYRIRKATHHRTGDAWCIYPMYDYAHALSDWIEGITHSLCTLEFEDHRPLYDWCLEALDLPDRPRQIEFARLNLTYTLLSKRKLLQLVTGGHVTRLGRPADAHDRGPPAPRLHARGHPRLLRPDRPRQARQRRRRRAARALPARGPEPPRAARHGRPRPAARRPHELPGRAGSRSSTPSTTPRTPRRERARSRSRRELLIERDDFREVPPPKYHRLSPGQEVRLRWGYIIRCEEVVKDPATGEIAELRCTYDPATRGGDAPAGRKVKGTIHWVSAAHALAGRGAALRPALLDGEPGRRARGTGLPREPEPRLARREDRLPRRAGARARPGRATSSSSSGSATSPSTPTPPPAASSSTAPSPCGTRGRRSRRREGRRRPGPR